MSSPPSLRERRRAQTRRQIHLAALELSSEHGFSHVTVESISVRAGISPRTFFNYFPSKESAIIMDPPFQLRGPAAERFAAGDVTEPRELLTELTDLVLQQLEVDPPDPRLADVVFEIALTDTSVLGALVTQMDAVRADLSETLTRRLPPDADPQAAGLIAALAMAAIRSGMEAWTGTAPEQRPATPVPFIRRAIQLIGPMSAT